MKLYIPGIVTAVLLPAGLLLFAGCTSAPKIDKATTVIIREGVPGGILVQHYQTTARVTAIDTSTRQVTFTAPDGSKNTFTAGPKVVLDQIQVGDDLNVSVARELSVYLDPKDAPAGPGAVAVVHATPGAKPGVLTSDPVQLTATVTSVDLSKQEATLQVSDGRTGTIKVRKDVDLTGVKPGTEVIIRTTSAVAILMEKP
jgi:hypothetical protein